MPGAPSSAATQMPLSSASAGRFVARAAARALMRALAMKVVPDSSGSGRPSEPADTASTPYGASSSFISRSLPALCVATTTVPVSARAMREALLRSADSQLLQLDEAADALLGQA